MTCFGPSRVQVNKKSIVEGRSLVYGVTVPCGICLGCRADQARDWRIRILHEAQMHKQSWFLTLTYNDEEIPGNGSLDPKHFQSFVKDLRRDYPSGSVSYYGCGEYGGKTARPHYHAVLFGPQFLDRYKCISPDRAPIWKSQDLDRYWGRGFAEIGTLTPASAAYVAGYVGKKIPARDFQRVDVRTGEILVQEFSRMSLKPAVGRRWIEDFWRDVYPRDFVVVDGREIRPPRYYDKWMDQNHNTKGACWPDKCEVHRDIMEEVRQKRYDEAIELSNYTLKAKQSIANSRSSLFGERDSL